MVSINFYLGLAIILFTIGALGVLIRRNSIIIFMSVELMLNAANLAFVAFARYWQAMSGQIFMVFFPVIGLLINLILGGKMGEKAIGAVACLASGLSFVVAVLLGAALIGQPEGLVGPYLN